MKKNLPIFAAGLLAVGLVYSLFPSGMPSPVERFGRLPLLDERDADDIVGYDDDGLPT